MHLLRTTLFLALATAVPGCGADGARGDADAPSDDGSDAADGSDTADSPGDLAGDLSDAEVDPDVAADPGVDPSSDSPVDAQEDAAGDASPADASDATGVDSPEDPGADADVGPDTDDAADADTGPMTAARCFAGQLPPGGVPLVDYDALGAVVGSHCMGTDHQDITGVERVVIAGDSLAVGTPPTPADQWYRNRLARALAARFDLEAPGFLWQQADVVNGVALQQRSGDFWSCAKWGARTDDIYRPPHQQLVACNPEGERSKRTLIMMTVGGNDIFTWAQDMQAGAPMEEIQAAAEQAIDDLEEAVRWVVDPATFPGGVYLVFASNFEFTDPDSGNDFASCPGAGIIAMDVALVDPRLHAITRWVMEEYMRIAVETGTDMIFMGERWCGHGHMNDDPGGRCYRGPGTPLWSDITCMHPNGDGHAAIAEMFLAVIGE